MERTMSVEEKIRRAEEIYAKKQKNKEPNTSNIVGFSVRTSGNSENKKEIKIDSDGNVIEESILINALPIVKLNNNSWDRIKSGLSGYETDGDGNLRFSDGYIAYCNKRYINKVIFNNIYTKEVIGHLKVGADFETIEKTLGTPTFKTKDYIGYKTKEVYAFFRENEITIYPNRKMSNKDLEELFESYFNKSYGKDRTYFLVDIRNNFDDFEIEMDEKNDIVTITSITRQVIAKLDKIGTIEVEFYDGYKVALDSTQKRIDNKEFKTNEENLIEIAESERVSGK